MLNREMHQLIMGKILRDIYTDTTISSLLGFKGGTCAYFFYNLPRFSVDLDFDLLKTDDGTQSIVMEKIKNILASYGKIKDEKNKRFTLFFLLSYGDTEHNIKIEINTRTLVPDIKNHYEIKEFLGIAILTAKKDYLFASKLMALSERNETATRDIYDIYFFGKESWDINRAVLELRSGKKTIDYLLGCIKIVEGMKENQILGGLGELVNDKDKNWVKNNLKKETIFVLKNYLTALK
jgi:predicted nucleotidyltransferase component of viral defense system